MVKIISTSERNTPPKCNLDFPERKKTLSSNVNEKSVENIFRIENTQTSMLYNIVNYKKLNFRKKINYQSIDKSQVINAGSYVYCGGIDGFPKNNLGVSLNELGELVLIKGKSHDLIKGMFKKYKSKHATQMAKLTDANYNIKFNHLYVNANGMLIGDEKDSEKSYSINIVNIPTKSDENEQSIKIFFVEYKKKRR